MTRHSPEPSRVGKKLSSVQQEDLIRQYMPVVRKVMHQVAREVHYRGDKLELFEYGVLGLVRCLETYQFDDRVPFSEYAKHKIYKHIISELKKERPSLFSGKQKEPKPRYELLHFAQVEAPTLPKDEEDSEYSKPSGKVSDTLELDESNPLMSLLTDEDSTLINLAIQHLPRRQAEIIRLSFFENLTSHEICRRLDLTAPRVSSLRTRALRELRKQLMMQN